MKRSDQRVTRRVFLTRPESGHSRDECDYPPLPIPVHSAHTLPYPHPKWASIVSCGCYFSSFSLRQPRFICNTRPHALLTPRPCAQVFISALQYHCAVAPFIYAHASGLFSLTRNPRSGGSLSRSASTYLVHIRSTHF